MSTNLIGKRINGYEVIRVLGRGGMGVVYKAHEMTLQRVVALKVLPNHLAENKEFITRFYREARAAAQLNHPNVVTIHRVGSDDGYHYIAMEYLKGRELTDIIKDKGQLEVNEALEIVRQMASALAAAHELGILHRDIKPHNVMIDNAGRVKVMDFGIAKINDSGGSGNTQALTMTGQLLGTPAYMS
ncbi:serine/threonine protein kinase, partial [Candidatus Sumerlaeota bacterium]|nr:serine/threonine protein kinase [Candidatus Sumerlaeota bacterium]